MPVDEGRTAEEEVVDRVNALLASETPETPAPADPAPDPSSDPDGGAAAPAAPATPSTPAAPAEPSIEIEGKHYTRAELQELLSKGAYRHKDYTQKTQALKDREREIEVERESLARQRRTYEEGLARVTGKRPAASTETGDEDDLDALDLSPEMRRILKREREGRKALEAKLSEYTTTREKEQREAQQTRVNAFIVEHADAEIREVMKEKGLPESMFGLVRHTLAMQNPDMDDPDTGELTRDSVKRAIRSHLLPSDPGAESILKPLLDYRDSISKTTVEDLKKAAKPPAKPGPGLRPAAPGKPVAPAAPAAAAANGQPANPWDDHDTINEVQNRILGVQPTGDYT